VCVFPGGIRRGGSFGNDSAWSSAFADENMLFPLHRQVTNYLRRLVRNPKTACLARSFSNQPVKIADAVRGVKPFPMPLSARQRNVEGAQATDLLDFRSTKAVFRTKNLKGFLIRKGVPCAFHWST
jgi:hypothetical protein